MNQPDRKSEPAHDRATGFELPVPPGVHEVVERSAGLRRGLGLLRKAQAEAVAAALGVHARAVEATRDRLASRSGRRQLLDLYARALEGRRSDPPAPAERPARLGPDDLIVEAERHPLGIDFLVRAHVETVAITFAVHPETVRRARELLAARGWAVPGGGEAS